MKKDIDDLFDDSDSDPIMDAPLKSPRSDGKNFIGCPVPWLLRVLPVVKSKKQLVVAIYVWKQYIACGQYKTFDMPNGGLKRFEISRWTKYRALLLLKNAGVIRVKRKGKEAFSITILPDKPKKKQAAKQTEAD